MPLVYCTRCTTRHIRPVGRQCRRHVQHPQQQGGNDQPDQAQLVQQQAVVAVVQEIRDAITELNIRMDQVEVAIPPPPNVNINQLHPPIIAQPQNQEPNREFRGENLPPVVQPAQVFIPPPQPQGPAVGLPPRQDGEGPLVDPNVIRQDEGLIARAHAALNAIVNVADLGDPTMTPNSNPFKRGKKSGATRTADDAIINDIPWPHFAIKRASDKSAPTYDSLGIDDFVFGFLSMLDQPRNNLDPAIMLPILKNLMQDSRDFSWKKAKDFYRDLAVEVEQGHLKWSDTAQINMLRMTECRTLKPADLASIQGFASAPVAHSNGNSNATDVQGTNANVSKPRSSQSPRPPPRPAPADTQPCVPYQSRSCAQKGNHGEFSHVCAYCMRVKKILCSHAEVDCIRKFTDGTKNGQQRD